MVNLQRQLLVTVAFLASLSYGHAASLHDSGIDVFSSHAGTALSSDAATRSVSPPPFSGAPAFPDASNDPAGTTAQYGRFTRSTLDGIDFSGLAPDALPIGRSDGGLRTANPELMLNADPFTAKTAGDVDTSAAPRDDRVKESGSSIPLPSALPLLAAAILALAGFGYGLNRWVAPRGRKMS